MFYYHIIYILTVFRILCSMQQVKNRNIEESCSGEGTVSNFVSDNKRGLDNKL